MHMQYAHIRIQYKITYNKLYSSSINTHWSTCWPLQYCHWFSELSFSRISESTTGYTFTSVWDHLLTLAWTTDRRDHQLLVFLPRHKQMWGERYCLSFETPTGGIEPPSPWLIAMMLYHDAILMLSNRWGMRCDCRWCRVAIGFFVSLFYEFYSLHKFLLFYFVTLCIYKIIR